MTCPRGCCDTYADHVRSISVSASATPNRRPHAATSSLKDKRWEKDHAAYRRMRREGLQPDSIDGSAQMEQMARTRYEIESGQPMPANIPTRKLKALINQGHEISAANNVAPATHPED